MKINHEENNINRYKITYFLGDEFIAEEYAAKVDLDIAIRWLRAVGIQEITVYSPY